MSKRNITISVATVMILIVASVWAFWNRADPQVEKIKQMHAEAFKEGLTPEQRRQNFELIRQEMDKLSPEQRHAVFDEGRRDFERRMDQRIDAYFALPPQERVAFLDKEIQEMEKRQREMQSRRPPNAGGPPGGPRPPQNNAPGARTTRHNQRLDNSTPEDRAKRSAYFADMQKRRYELGLPIMPQRPR